MAEIDTSSQIVQTADFVLPTADPDDSSPSSPTSESATVVSTQQSAPSPTVLFSLASASQGELSSISETLTADEGQAVPTTESHSSFLVTTLTASTTDISSSYSPLSLSQTTTSTSGAGQSAVQQSQDTAQRSDLSTGAKAGIAVGVILVVLIVLGAVLVLIRKRFHRSWNLRQKAPSQVQHGETGTMTDQGTRDADEEKPIVVIAVAAKSHDSGDEETEPVSTSQPDDDTVRSRFSTLYDQIEQHIENFYSDSSPIIPPTTEGMLSQYDTPTIKRLAAALEESPRTRTILKHVLAYDSTVIAMAPLLRNWVGNGRGSILPNELVVAWNEMSNEQEVSRGEDSTSPAYARLRGLAAQYRNPEQNLSTTAINRSAVEFTHVFDLWADPRSDHHSRIQHLVELLRSAFDVSIWLLAHPDRFEIHWDKDGSGTHGRQQLVVVPTLIKVAMQGGRNMQPMKMVIRKSVSRDI